MLKPITSVPQEEQGQGLGQQQGQQLKDEEEQKPVKGTADISATEHWWVQGKKNEAETRFVKEKAERILTSSAAVSQVAKIFFW